MTLNTENALAVLEREEAGTDGQPDWITPELPPHYAELANRIQALKDEARGYEQAAAVLWQTGRPLIVAVRNLFSSLHLESELAAPGANYDICVQLDETRRFLVVVVASPEPINRKSRQIGQILRTLQEDAGEMDRVVLAANVFSELPPPARQSEPVHTDALRLIQGLGGNFVATSTLFGIWKYSLQDAAGAKRSLVNLHSLDGGIFR